MNRFNNYVYMAFGVEYSALPKRLWTHAEKKMKKAHTHTQGNERLMFELMFQYEDGNETMVKG